MYDIWGIVDPNNDENHYIFGCQSYNDIFGDQSDNSCECYKFDYKKQEYIRFESGELSQKNKQILANDWGCQCVYFELQKENFENFNFQFVLFCWSFGSYAIYEINNQKWNKNLLNVCKKTMPEGYQGHIAEISLITDIFETNKIHIMVGNAIYGYFNFNRQMLSDSNLSKLFLFFGICFLFCNVFDFNRWQLVWRNVECHIQLHPCLLK